MARLARFNIPGYPQHVIIRGNNRSDIFHHEDDCLFYLEKLNEACVEQACAVHAYVLMTNHVHLLLTPQTDDGLSKTMQKLGRNYVRYFNDAYGRTGTLWEGRYRATVVDSQRYLLTCSRYIELNPVRAARAPQPKGARPWLKMPNHPSKYRWSSYAANALGEADPLVTPHSVYLSLARTQAGRQKAYRALFKERISQDTLTAIRDATNKGWALGDAPFRRALEKVSNRPATPRPRGGDRRSEDYKKSRKPIKGV